MDMAPKLKFPKFMSGHKSTTPGHGLENEVVRMYIASGRLDMPLSLSLSLSLNIYLLIYACFKCHSGQGYVP
jgi:hypothetical protein